MAAESLASRSTQLTQLVLEKGNHDLAYRHLVSREGLLDALFALYDECCHDYMRKNKNISKFVDKFSNAIMDLRKLQVNVKDFELKRIIGRGHFGEVHMVREKHTGNMYAMKTLKKNLTLEQEAVAFYEEERDIMMKAKSPWVTQLQYSFQDAKNLYLVMEFHPGGDLLALLDRHGNILPEDVAVFYAAELVLAVHSVHSMGYVHRDIKPDNILIDLTGHLKLADFGSAAKLNEEKLVTSKMPVGTPDYIAPEVLTAMNSNRPSFYNENCDWWSVGIVTYEMMFGATPFGDDKLLVTYANIMNYKTKLDFPDDIEYSDAAKSMIEGCLTDSRTRIGYKELYNHQFFKAIDWANILKVSPPYVPTISGEDDTSYFDTFEQDSHKPSLDPYKPVKEFTGKNLPFVGFTYSSCLANETENTARRMSISYDTYHTLPKSRKKSGDTSTKTTSDVELKKLVVSLESMQSALKSENSLLKGKLERTIQSKDELEREKELLREINMKQASEISSLKSLLEMEKKHRANSDERAMELLKAIEQKYKKREAILNEGFRNRLMLSPAKKFVTANDAANEAYIESPSKPVIRNVHFREPVVESEKVYQRYYSNSTTSSGSTNETLGSDSVEPNETVQDSFADVTMERSAGSISDVGNESVFAVTLEDGSLLREESSSDELFIVKHELSYTQTEVEKLQKELELTKAELSEYKMIEVGAFGDNQSFQDDKRNVTTVLSNELKALQEKYDLDCQSLKDKLRITENTCSKLNDLVDTIRKDLDEAVTANKTLEIEKEEFKSSAEMLKGIVMRLEGDLKDVETKLRRNSVSAAAILSESFDANDTSADLKSKLMIKETELNEVKSKVRALEDKVAMLQSELQIAQTEADNTMQKYKAVKKDAMATVTTLQANLNLVKNEKESLNRKMEEVENNYEAILRDKERKLVETASQLESTTQKLTEVERSLHNIEENAKLASQQVETDGIQTKPKVIIANETQKSPRTAELDSKVSNMESVLNRIHETQLSETSQIRQLRDVIRQKEREISDAKLDLRISQREKKESEEALERSRSSNQNLREKLSNLEKEHVKCSENENNLKEKIVELQQSLDKKIEDLERLSKEFEIEKERLEERIKLLKEEYNTKRQLEEKCAKNEGQYQELDRQSMKLKEQCYLLEDQKQKLLSENESLKVEVMDKNKRCEYLERNTGVLKNVCCTLEEQIKDFELIIEKQEEDQAAIDKEKNSMSNEIERLKHELKSINKNLEAEIVARQEAEQQLDEVENELSGQIERQDIKVSTLERTVEAQSSRIAQLTEQRTIMEREVELKVNAYCNLKVKMDSLEEESVSIKEEAARHITTISQLKKKNIDLQEALEQSMKRYEELEWHVDSLMNEKERDLATYQQELSKRESQIQQLTKVTDLLQSRIREMEKKKKHWLFGSRGKENKGPIIPPAENKRDRENRMYKEMKEVAEKMTMKPPDSPASVRSDGTSDSASSAENEIDRLSRGGTGSGSMRMKHNIPHVLYDAHSTWNTVCSICTTSIRFSKPCVKCRSCDVIVHRQCKDKVENTCGLPKQLAESLRAVKERIRQGIYTSFNLDDMDGWVKIPRNRNAGWEERFMKLVGTTLCILDREPEQNTNSFVLAAALSKFELAPDDGIVTIKENPSQSEIPGASANNIPLMLKLTYWPHIKELPNKDFLVLLSTDEDKFHWSAAIERVVSKHLQAKGKIIDPAKLQGSKVLTLENTKIEPTCCCHLNKNILLIGTTEGLFAFDLNKSPSEAPQPIMPNVGTVHSLTTMDRIAVFLMVAGDEKFLYSLSYTDVLSKVEFGHTNVNVTPVSNVKQCQRVVASHTPEITPQIIAIATSSYVALLKWNAANRSFIMKQETRISQPCSYIHITAHVVLFATDKLYVVDLKEPGTCVEEFMDQASNNMLAMFINDVLKKQQSSVCIATVSPPGKEEEYLVCLKDLGVVINYLGQQDNPNQLNWTKQPFQFAYQGPTLFVIYKNIVEVLEITPSQSSLRGKWSYLNIPYPRYLGSAGIDGDVYISNSKPDIVEIYRLSGPKVLEESSMADGVSNHLPLRKSESNLSGGSDFSFTSSLEEALDTSDIMSAVLETSRNTE